jgi:hypothetical protein
LGGGGVLELVDAAQAVPRERLHRTAALRS